MKTTMQGAPKNDLQLDLSEQDVLHTIELDPAQLLQFEKLTNQQLNDFRFLLPFGEYMFELPDTNFIKQAIKDNALRIEYYDPYEDIVVIRSGEGDTNSTLCYCWSPTNNSVDARLKRNTPNLLILI